MFPAGALSRVQTNPIFVLGPAESSYFLYEKASHFTALSCDLGWKEPVNA